MSEHSYWWRWLVVLALPVLLWTAKEEKTAAPAPPELSFKASLEPVHNKPAPPAKSDFKKEWQTVLKSLPTTKALMAQEGRDFHHTPSEVLDGGGAIGRITDQLKKDPSRMKEGMAFYEACAANEEILTALRAVCLRTLWDISEKLGKRAVGSYAPDISWIAENLPPTRW